MENKQRKKSVFDRFIAWILLLLQKSLTGRFFTSYEKANDRFLRLTKGKERVSKKRLARFIERNGLVVAVQKAFRFLLRVPLRDYGIMMFMAGGVVAVLYPLNNLITFDVTFEMFVLGAATCVCALPLFFSSRSLAENVLSSSFFSHILFDFLGIDDEGFRDAAEKEKISFATFAFIIGAGLGVASYFVLPTYTILIVLGVVLAYCTFRTPEVGAIVTILAIPFVDILYSCILVAFTFFCYIIKAFLGKRIFKYEYFDFWVMICIIVMTAFGVNYSDPLSSLKNVLINLMIMLSYFLFSNLIYSKIWFRRSIIAFTTSSLVVAVVAIVQAILGKMAQSVVELNAIVPSNAEIASTFGSSGVLAQFMVIAIPFAIVHMISEKKDFTKFVGFLLSVLFITALVLAHSAAGLVGLVIGALLVFAFFKKKAVYLILILAIGLPILYFTLPEHIVAKAFTLGPFANVSIEGELLYFKEIFLQILDKPMGVGIGGTTVMAEFGQEYIDSLPLQILASYGVVGGLVFVITVAMFIRVILSYSVKAKNEYRRVNGCAGLCSVLPLLLVGTFSNVWFDKKIFLLFVITIALSLAYIKIDREEEGVLVECVDISRATIDIALKETAVVSRAQERRYVHAPRMKKQLKRQEKIRSAEAKEFSNTEELFISKRKYSEETEQEE